MSSIRAFARRLLAPWRTSEVERLRRAGVRIGRNVSLQPGVVLDESHAWLIEIGDDATLAPRVVILAHDASCKRILGFTRIGCVSIGERSFIGGNAVVLPGVRIGSDCVVGAGSVVTRDVPAGHVAAGNPARIVGTVADLMGRRRQQLAAGPCFGREYTLHGGITEAMRREMQERLAGRCGFVE